MIDILHTQKTGIEHSIVVEEPDFNKDDLPIHTCKLNHRQICRFSKLNFNSTHLNFHPKSLIPENQVKVVDLGGNTFEWSSKIHTLTDDICKKFPNINYYRAFYLGLERIQANAFSNCRALEKLDLSRNKLMFLCPHILEHNSLITHLVINDNLIRHIDAVMFKTLGNLKLLNVDKNRLLEFPVKEMKALVNLKVLVLSNNPDLQEFDENDIMEKFPSIRWFWARGSEKINKDKIWKQLDFFEQKHIFTDKQFFKTPEGENIERNITYEGPLPIFTCYKTLILYTDKFCFFDYINLTTDKPYFKPISNMNVDDVNEVGFVAGIMEIFTNDTCDTFPNTKVIFATGLRIQDVLENAFIGCPQLEKIMLDQNRLTNLKSNIFMHNHNLKDLSLSESGIIQIDVEFFSQIAHLEILNLATNNLSTFPPKDFPKMANLILLSLQGNNITELNFEEILNKFPNLKLITICKNNLLDDAEQTIKTFFGKHSINAGCMVDPAVYELDQFI